MAAQTFRRVKVTNFYRRLYARREELARQLERKEYQDLKETITAEIRALDLVLSEIVEEFDLSPEEINR
jgi:predicted transposase YdaD